jgi:hypothetical protein
MVLLCGYKNGCCVVDIKAVSLDIHLVLSNITPGDKILKVGVGNKGYDIFNCI